MAAFRSVCLWTFLLIASHHHVFVAATKACYYPNGDISTEDVPCGSGDAEICCPLNWECMGDGLCYLANENYYERHTCTDASWPSTACPRICTADMSEGGNQALLWCPSGDWCCDGNRSFNCCTTAGTDFFQLADPKAFASITIAPSVNPDIPAATNAVGNDPTGLVPGSTTPSATSTTSTSSTASSTTSSFSAASTTEIVSHVTTGQNGATTVVTSVVIASASNTAATSSKQSTHSNLPIIVGLAVGIPLLCLLGAVIAFFLFRHRRRQGKDEASSAQAGSADAKYSEFPPDGRAPELAGFPVAAKRARTSELYGSESYQSPALSTRTNASGPPQYSPGTTGGMSQIQEEPQELWGGYVPYRGPHDGGRGPRDAPETKVEGTRS